LGDIPILGWLFKGRSTQRAKINLLVFITPKIIRNRTDQRNLLGNKLNERLDFVKDNLGGRDPYGKTVDKMYRKTTKGKTVDPTPVE
jgi:general secretion pathway protein D